MSDAHALAPAGGVAPAPVLTPDLQAALALKPESYAAGSPEAHGAARQFTALTMHLPAGHPFRAQIEAAKAAIYARAVGDSEAGETSVRASDESAGDVAPSYPAPPISFPDDVPPETVAAGVAEAMGWAKAAGLETPDWQSFATRFDLALGGEKYTAEQAMAQLQGALGAKADETLAAARTAVSRIDPSGRFREFLDSSGMGNDSVTILKLAGIARRQGWSTAP